LLPGYWKEHPLAGITFTDAAGQCRDKYGEPTFVTSFKNNFQIHKAASSLARAARGKEHKASIYLNSRPRAINFTASLATTTAAQPVLCCLDNLSGARPESTLRLQPGKELAGSGDSPEIAGIAGGGQFDQLGRCSDAVAELDEKMVGMGDKLFNSLISIPRRTRMAGVCSGMNPRLAGCTARPTLSSSSR
jgi:hypothetical protein